MVVIRMLPDGDDKEDNKGEYGDRSVLLRFEATVDPLVG